MFTVWQVDQFDKIRRLFTGRYDECCDAIEFLIAKKGWDIGNLGIIDHETERWVSFTVKV